MDWVTGAAILVHAGVPAPSTADTAWADLCALAVSAGIDSRLAGVALVDPLPAEITRLALEAGVDAYKAREASSNPASPDAIAADYLAAQERILGRYATTGIA